MRNARLVGLSPDGKSVIVATDGGEELAVAADDRLRAAVSGHRPRLGQLENEMETSLSPRDIQTRIRAGATLDEVAQVAGLPLDRVERFAAPVLAERDHVAITAMASSVRRRGETSGHRNLRITITERLVARGVDIDALAWDAFRLDDGRWTVTAEYPAGSDAGSGSKHAEFRYDPRGRFSVAGNDEARALLGDLPVEPSAGDLEPTVDLSDELALVRATQEREAVDQSTEPTIAVVRSLKSVPDSAMDALDDMLSAGADDEDDPADDYAGLSDPAGTNEPTIRVTELTVTEVTVTGLTVDEPPAEASVVETPGTEGPSDASAVPETTDRGGWEPAIVVNVPVEPSLVDDEGDGGTDEPGPPDPIVDGAGRADEVVEFELEAQESAPVHRPAAKKKRASVPSWDEIMFGGPRPPSR